MVPESFGKFLPWRALLAHLGRPAEAAVLPAAVPCPLCHDGEMTVFPDRALGSTWFRCPGCGFAGDGLALAGHAWPDRNDPEVVAELSRAGLLRDMPDDDGCSIADNREQRVLRWVRARACAGGAVVGNAATILRQRFGLDDALPGVCGVARAALDAFLGHRNRLIQTWPKGRARACPAADYARLGPDWREMVGLVYEDLPGRVRGLVLAGGGGRWPGEWSYRSMLAVPSCRRGPANRDGGRDAGLFNLSAVLDAPCHPWFGPTVFAVDRPDWALALLARYRRDHGEAVPVVAAWRGVAGGHSTGASWDLLAGRPVVHLVERVDVDTVLAARRTGGTIRGGVGDPARLATPLEWAAAAAWLSWEDGVQSLLLRASDVACTRLLRGLDLSAADRADLAGRLSRATRPRLERLLAAGNGAIRSTPGRDKRYRIVEANGEWRTGRGLLISDAILRVDRHVYFPAADPDRLRDKGKPTAAIRYQGRVLFRGREYPFDVPGTDGRFVFRTMEWLRNVVGRAAGALVGGQHGLRRSLLDVAREFHPPEEVVVPPFVGWDREEGGFVFPTFRLRANGEVERLPVPLTALDEDLPFADAEPSTAGDRERAAALDPAILATLAAFAACLVEAGPPGPTFAAAYNTAAVVADACGIDIGRPASRRTEVRFRPGVVTLHPHVSEVWAAPPVEAARAAIGLGHHVVGHDTDSRVGPVDPAAIRQTLVAYLQDLLRRRMQLPAGPCLCSRVRAGLAAWAGVDIPAAAIVCPSAGGALAYALRVAIAAGLARVDTDTSLRRHGPTSLLRAVGEMHLPLAVFRALARDGREPPDAAAVERAIAAAGLEVRPREILRERGWLVAADWFDSNVVPREERP